MATKKRPAKTSKPQVTVLPSPGTPPFKGPVLRLEDLFIARPILGARSVLYNPDEAVRRSRDEANNMLNDLSIKAPVEERKLSVAHLPWHLVPEDLSDPAGVQMAKDLTSIILRTPRFHNYLQVLLDGVFHGRSACQNIYGWRQVAGHSAFCITDWLPVHGDTLVFDYQGGVGCRVGLTEGDLEKRVELNQEGRVIRLTPFERSYFVVHMANIQAGFFEDIRSAGRVKGLGLRSYLYWAWKHKTECVANLLDYLERWAQGWNVVYFEESNDAQVAAIKAQLESDGCRNVLLLPHPREANEKGPEVEHKEVVGRGLDHLREVIDGYWDRLMRQYIIGQTLSSGTASTGLGSGVAQLHELTKDLIVRNDAVSLAETLSTELVEPLIKFNRAQFDYWPIDGRIAFRFDVEAPNVDELLKAGETMFKIGVPFDQDEFRSKIGFSKPQTDPNKDVSNQGQLPPSPLQTPTGRLALSKCKSGTEVQALLKKLYP